MNAIRLLSEFHAGSLTVADMVRRTIDPANLDVVMTLAAEAGKLADAAGRKLGLGGEGDTTRASTLEMAEALGAFHFPDDLWARLIYDLVLSTRRGEVDTGQMVAALVPIYFGRVGSFVSRRGTRLHDRRRGAGRALAGLQLRAVRRRAYVRASSQGANPRGKSQGR